MKNMREGEIYYNIKYINNPSSLSSDLLPRELVISFRNDLLQHKPQDTLSATRGSPSVINPKENIFDTYLNILSFKYYCEGNSKDMQPGFSSMEGMTFMIQAGSQSSADLTAVRPGLTFRNQKPPVISGIPMKSRLRIRTG